MKISKENFLNLTVENKSKKRVIEQLSKQLFPQNWRAAQASFLKREKEFSTGLVDGFAIPHAKLDFIEQIGFYFVNLSEAIEWGTLDESKVGTLIVMVIPDEDNNQIKMLSSISKMMMNNQFKQAIKEQDAEFAQKLIEEKL